MLDYDIPMLDRITLGEHDVCFKRRNPLTNSYSVLYRCSYEEFATLRVEDRGLFSPNIYTVGTHSFKIPELVMRDYVLDLCKIGRFDHEMLIEHIGTDRQVKNLAEEFSAIDEKDKRVLKEFVRKYEMGILKPREAAARQEASSRSAARQAAAPRVAALADVAPAAPVAPMQSPAPAPPKPQAVRQAMPASPSTPPPPPADAVFRFYAIIDGKQQGPFDEEEFEDLVYDDEIDGDTYVWTEGMDGWKHANEVSRLEEFVGSAPPPVAAAFTPSPAPAPSPSPSPAPVAPPAPAAAPAISTRPAEQPKPASQKHGDLRKCPSCGEMVPAASLVCKACGHDFRNVDTVSSVQRLSDQLASMSMSKGLGKKESKEKDEAMMSVIRMFPVPNAKEDIIEFLALAAPNARPKGGILGTIVGRVKVLAIATVVITVVVGMLGLIFADDPTAGLAAAGMTGFCVAGYGAFAVAEADTETLRHNKFADAWRDKFQQVLLKGRSLRGDAEFKQMLDYYEGMFNK